jgi:hypothetical protein
MLRKFRRGVAADVDPVVLIRRLAEVFETARPTRVKADHVRVDQRRVRDIVKLINRATGTRDYVDWRGRVRVEPTSSLAEAADQARDLVARSRRLPLTDDVLLRSDRAVGAAQALRRAAE